MPYDAMGRYMPYPQQSRGNMPMTPDPSAGALGGQAAGPSSQMGDIGTIAGTIDDPEIRELLLAAYGDQLEMTELDRQLQQANALRETGMPEGRSAGRVYTAANPLEFLGAGIKQYAGMRDAKRIEAERDEIRRRMGEAVSIYGRNLPNG